MTQIALAKKTATGSVDIKSDKEDLRKREMLPESIVSKLEASQKTDKAPNRINGNQELQKFAKGIVQELQLASKNGPEALAEAQKKLGIDTPRKLLNAVWIAETGGLVNSAENGARVDKALTRIFNDPKAFDKLAAQISSVKPVFTTPQPENTAKPKVSVAAVPPAVASTTDTPQPSNATKVVVQPVTTAQTTEAKELSREKIKPSLEGFIPAIANEAEYVTAKDKKGNAIGLQVNKIQDKSLLKDLGLKDGDIVLSANGTAVKSLTDASALVDPLLKADKVEVKIQRDGAEKTLSFVIK